MLILYHIFFQLDQERYQDNLYRLFFIKLTFAEDMSSLPVFYHLCLVVTMVSGSLALEVHWNVFVIFLDMAETTRDTGYEVTMPAVNVAR